GVVFNDTNGNGRQDKGEKGIAGRTVYLDLNHNGKLDKGEPTARTSADGVYRFTGLAAGNYVVREITPSGWRATSPDWLRISLLEHQTFIAKAFGSAPIKRIA